MTGSVGFIGVGTMGAPMVRNLLHSGMKVFVHDVRRQAANGVCRAGAKWVDDVQNLCQQTRTVFTSLPGPKEIEQVAFGDRGLIASLEAGSLWVDTSSNSASLARRLSQACAAAGADFLDAPVTGGAVGARDATLKIMVGGKSEIIARVRHVLERIGGQIIETGPAGTGCAMKLVLNFLSISSTGVVAEALTLGRASGLDLETMLAVFTGGYGDSVVLHDTVATAKGPRAWEFAATLARKDVDLAVALAKELDLQSRYGELTVRLLDECIADPTAADDVWSLVQGYERRAKVTIA